MKSVAILAMFVTALAVALALWFGTIRASPPTLGIQLTLECASATLEFLSPDDVASTFECQLDAQGWGTCTNPKSYSGLSEGLYTFEVRAVDQASNKDATQSTRTWNILADTTPPNTFFDSFPFTPSSEPNPVFEFSSSEPGGTFECQLDGQGWLPCSSPKTYSGLSDGQHTLLVGAVDQAGNKDPTPASRTWTISTG